MDSLFHFIFPVIAAMAAQLHMKHAKRNILLAAFLAVLIDVDHFFGLERGLFHNIFITVMLPVIFVLLAFHLKKSYELKVFSLLLLIFLSSHLFLDIFTEPGVAIFYPFSDNYYSIDLSVMIPLNSQFTTYGQIISPAGIALLLYFLMIILPCYYLDNIVEIMENKHEDFKKAFKDLTHPGK